MHKFNVIKTDKDIYIQSHNEGYRSNHETHRFLFDGKKSRETFHKNWAVIDSIPKEIQAFKGGEICNPRYILKNPRLESTLIPISISAHDIQTDDDANWIGKYAGLNYLYEYTYSKEPDTYEPIEFTINVIHTIDKIEEYVGFSFKTLKTKWEHDGFKDFSMDGIHHPIVDEILYPDILRHSRPSFLNSKDSYDIVRAHVKLNINPRYAEITSDYDFCFAVSKKIKLFESEKYTVNEGTSKKPKIETRYRNDRKVQIFEMTYSPENYKGYTPFPGFTGNNHKNLKENIDKFLDGLMAKINAPLEDCARCKGMGVIIEKTS